MTTLAINRSESSLPVTIEFPEQVGRPPEFVFLQPKSKAKLPSGSRVSPEFVALHPKELSLVIIDGLGEPVVPL